MDYVVEFGEFGREPAKSCFEIWFEFDLFKDLEGRDLHTSVNAYMQYNLVTSLATMESWSRSQGNVPVGESLTTWPPTETYLVLG